MIAVIRKPRAQTTIIVDMTSFPNESEEFIIKKMIKTNDPITIVSNMRRIMNKMWLFFILVLISS
jgi:hypothetical protein